MTKDTRFTTAQDPADSTVVRYRRLAATLTRRFAENTRLGVQEQVDPIKFVRWLRDEVSDTGPATLRQYKAAILFALKEHAEAAGPGSDAVYRDAISELTEFNSGMAGKATQTSARKPKKIPLENAIALLQAMAPGRSLWARRAVHFFLAGIGTGLRPVEWKSALLQEDGKTLLVQNAKTTQGRGNGKERLIPLPEEAGTDGWLRASIQSHYHTLKKWLDEGKEFEEYRELCQRALNRTCEQLWPNQTRNHYTLYTGRHQFTANLKASGASRREVADRMGHRSTRTAGRHYGKKRSGWAPGAEGISLETANTESPKVIKQSLSDGK